VAPAGRDASHDRSLSPAPPTATGAPDAVEIALRRVRTIAAVAVAARLLTAGDLPQGITPVWIVALGGSFASVSVISWIAQREPEPLRGVLGAAQLVADAVIVLVVLWLRRDHATADWALLALPVVEGALRFRVVGAIATWSLVGLGTLAWRVAQDAPVAPGELGQRLTVVLLVALPSGFLAHHLAGEIGAHRQARDLAEQRGALLRAAALGGRRSTSLVVDEILDVLRATVGQMGFADPSVFALGGPPGNPPQVARPVRGARDVLAITAGDPRLHAAARARALGGLAVWPPPGGDPGPRGAPAPYSRLVAVPLAGDDDGEIAVLTARWPEPGPPPDAWCESLELFASQAGAALRNAQVHARLQAHKEQLAHEAMHDALTDLPNRRRFHDELERTCARGGHAGDLIGVLFCDLDGFKAVNDELGHDAGNDLLVEVARRLRGCVRPGDLVARLGGDEFTVVLTRLSSTAPAIEVAERIAEALAEPFLLPAGAVRVSASIGIAVAGGPAADPADLVRRADVAMYHAKRRGKAGWILDTGGTHPVPDSLAERPGPPPGW
jgi:diguanylate cyclase (GGDEF)-like protein